MLRETLNVLAKTACWGVIGLFMHMIKAFDVKEHIWANNKPLFVLIIMMVILIYTTTIVNLWLNETSVKYKFNRITSFIYDQLHDGAISIFGLVSLTIISGLAVTQQTPQFLIFTVLLLSWSFVCAYGKYIYNMVTSNNIDILDYFKNSKNRFLHTKNGATAFISVITILGLAYLIYGYSSQV
jgi:hypothetical protein